MTTHKSQLIICKRQRNGKIMYKQILNHLKNETGINYRLLTLFKNTKQKLNVMSAQCEV